MIGTRTDGREERSRAGEAANRCDVRVRAEERQSRGRIEQPIVERISNAEPAGADIVNIGCQRSRASRDWYAAYCRNDGRRSIDVGPIDVRFEADNYVAGLNLSTKRAAEHPARKGNAEGVKAVRQNVERILTTPRVATVHADIKSRPIVDLLHGDGSFVRRLHRQIGGLCSDAGRHKRSCSGN